MKTYKQRIIDLETAVNPEGPVIHVIDIIGKPTVFFDGKDMPRAEFEAVLASPEGKCISVVQIEYVQLPIPPAQNEKSGLE